MKIIFKIALLINICISIVYSLDLSDELNHELTENDLNNIIGLETLMNWKLFDNTDVQEIKASQQKRFRSRKFFIQNILKA